MKEVDLDSKNFFNLNKRSNLSQNDKNHFSDKKINNFGNDIKESMSSSQKKFFLMQKPLGKKSLDSLKSLYEEKNFGHKKQGNLTLYKELQNDLYSSCLETCKNLWSEVGETEFNDKIKERFNILVDMVFKKSQCLVYAILDEDYQKWLALLQVKPDHSEQISFQKLCNLMEMIIFARRDSFRRQSIIKLCKFLFNVIFYIKFSIQNLKKRW